ncbi:MAG: hypothetical protein IID33_01955, partial [Planctomycetes bacterium]|nr:hypothetical protein [Planctomycetota bacterium]
IEAAAAERELTQSLSVLRKRWRLYVALSGAVRLSIVIIFTSLLQLMLDRWFKLAVDQRAVLNAVLTGFWLWLLYRSVIAPLLSPLTDRSLAGVVDGAHRDLHDRFATAVQFAAGQIGDEQSNSPILVKAAIEDAQRDARRVSFVSVLNHRRALQRSAELTGLATIVLVAFVVMSDIMPTWFQRNWMLRDVPWPQRTRLIPLGFEDGRKRFPRGDELSIVAVIDGEVPKSQLADIIWHTPSGRSGRETMMLVVGERRFHVSLGMLSEDLTFRLVGGDERTREYTVEAAERPHVIRLTASVVPPEYTGLEPYDVERQSFFKVLDGSSVRIDARTNKPIAEARFTASDGSELPCEIVADDLIRIELSEPRSGLYRIDLIDRDNWSDRNPVRVTLRVEQDRAPSVRMEMTGVGDFVTPNARLSIDLKFEDNYGLATAELFGQRGDAQAQSTALDGFAPAMREFEVSTQFDLSAAGAGAGDRVRVWAAASDSYPAGPNIGSSPQVELRVLSREDFLNEMARREYALRNEFERLLTGQRILRDSLERIARELSDGQPAAPRISQRLATLARRQGQHARRCLVIRTQFNQILAEMWTSRVAGAVVDRRITDGVMTPMGELAREAMPAAAAAVTELRSSVNAQQKQTALTRQDDVLRAMRAILVNMLKSEGFREAVELLRQIIGEQGDLRSETLEALDRQIEDILDLGDVPSDDDEPEPPTP